MRAFILVDPFAYGVGVTVAPEVGTGVSEGPGVGVTRFTGTSKIWPAKIELGLSRSFALMMASTVLKNSTAVASSVSPGSTKYSISSPRRKFSGKAVGVGISISGLGMINS